MTYLEQIADLLAIEALEAEKTTGNEKLINLVAQAMGASSTTLEESFLTAIRIRRAETRARELLESMVASHKG